MQHQQKQYNFIKIENIRVEKIQKMLSYTNKIDFVWNSGEIVKYLLLTV